MEEDPLDLEMIGMSILGFGTSIFSIIMLACLLVI